MPEDEQQQITQFDEAFRNLLQKYPKIALNIDVAFPHHNMADLPQEVSYCIYLLKKYDAKVKLVYGIKK